MRVCQPRACLWQTTGNAEVTKVRIVGDSRENDRRISEEVNRQGRRQKLLYEAESSARQNAAVAMKWSALFDKEIPQELLQEIEMQRDTCDRIIQSKDRLIKEFKTELKAKDDEYVKSLKKQAEDIDLLLERMGRQYGMLRKAFEDELDDVETAFMQERHELMTANGTELTSLMERRKEQEEQYMEARRGRVEEHQLQLQAQRVYVRAPNSHRVSARSRRRPQPPGPDGPCRAVSRPVPAHPPPPARPPARLRRTPRRTTSLRSRWRRRFRRSSSSSRRCEPPTSSTRRS